MDTETSPKASPYGSPGSQNPLAILVTSLSAAIVVAGGFAIVIEAFAVAATELFQLGQWFLIGLSALNIIVTIWLALWCFTRSWHVERRLRAGLDVDEPRHSILANWRE